MTVKGAAAGRREERRLEKLERAAAKRRQVEDDIQRRKMGRRIIGDMKMEGHYEDASFLQMLASLIPFILALLPWWRASSRVASCSRAVSAARGRWQRCHAAWHRPPGPHLRGG